MIFRLLLLFLIVWFLIWLFKKQFSVKQDNRPPLKSEQAEDMLACAYCGTHVPKSLAIEYAGKYYCCQEHADRDHMNADG